MITPNKVISFHDSILSKMLFIVDIKGIEKISIQDLYNKVDKHFDLIDEFIYSLDILYLLDFIDVDFDNGVITYVN